MPAYPTLPQMEGTKLVARSGVKLLVASNGQIRSRAISAAAYFDAVVVHTALTLAQWTTFLAFYSANRATTFSFTLTADGTSLPNCLFAEKPFDVVPIISSAGPMFNVTANIVQAQ